MSDQFNSWWHNGEAPNNNPYEPDSAAYWAWEGWCAGVAAEREACAKYFDEHWRETWTDEQIAEAIRARGQA